MEIARTRIVFDRKKIASRTKAAAVYIEVGYKTEKKLYNTGVKLYSGQFRNDRVVNHGQMGELQARINAMRSHIEDYITDRVKAMEPFTFRGLDVFLGEKNGEDKDSFLKFMWERILERPISDSTRRMQVSIYNTLKKWGRIRQFADISEANLKRWDELACKNARKAKSVWNYHKVLKIYIREAKCFGHIKENPYDKVKFKRDNSPGHRFVTPEELERIKSLPLTEKALRDARLCFLFQCYTSLAYSDMAKFDMTHVRRTGGKMRLRGQRVKTGETYNITLLSPAMKILEECGFVLPVQDLHVYNRNLQAIQYRAGIETHLTSHVGRHTFATSIALKNKMPIEVLQKVMGHESIRTTQIYAKVLQESVDEEFDRLDTII